MYEHIHIREKIDVLKWAIIRIFRPNFPKNYEWFYTIPEEDLGWVTDVIAVITDNCQVYQCKGVVELAAFLWYDQGTEAGIVENYRYLAAKELGIKSEEEYMEHYETISLRVIELLEDSKL